MDYFPSVANQFSSEMSRPAKLNLLLQSEDVPNIQAKLDEHLAKRSRKNPAISAHPPTRFMMYAALGVGLCVCALVVAAALWPKPDPKPGPTGPLAVDLSLPIPTPHKPQVSFVMEVLQPDGTTRVVEPSDVLCSGESFRLLVEVDAPSYLYVAQGRDGHGQLLYPPEQSDPIKLHPGRFYSVPDEAQLELDSHVGLEQIFLLASQKPLSPSAIVQFVEQALRSAEPPASPRSDRSCSPKAAKRPNAARNPPTVPVYKEIVLRQNLPRQVLANTTLVRIPIVHR